jgi:predicted ATPase
VVGEAGVGKSRLCSQFIDRARVGGTAVYEAHCLSHGKTVSFLPILELIRTLLGISEGEAEHDKRRKIAGELVLFDKSFDDALPLVLDFLGVPDPEQPAPLMAAEARQRQLFNFVRRLVRARSAREPAVLFIDDVHWIDAGSDAFLAQIVEAVTDTRALLLVNFRPEYHADWMGKSEYQQLSLRPLGPEEIEALLHELIGEDASVAVLPDLIRERTGGNPFFIEEVVHSLAELGNLEGARGAYRLVRPIETLEVPTTVQPVLAGRIDRLPEREKQLLQTAAVIGKEFSESLLKRVAQLPTSDLAAALSQLQSAEFILEAALYPEVEYAFKHPLTQQVAYDSQLSERRRHIHSTLAHVLEELSADELDEHVALLAHHCEEAGLSAQAIVYYERAAARAVREKSAHAEATAYLTRALRLLEQVKETPERTRTELRLQLALGGSLDAYPEVRRAFTRAKTLCEQVGDDGDLFAATWGLLESDIADAEFESAQRLGGELLHLADRINDPGVRLSAHHASWAVDVLRGKLASAKHHADLGVSIYRPAEHHPLTLEYGGHDPGVCALNYGAMAVWLLGFSDQALARNAEALELGRTLSHADSLADCMPVRAFIQHGRGDVDAVEQSAVSLIDLAKEHDLEPQYGAAGVCLRGWVLAQRGRASEGIAMMCERMPTLEALALGDIWPRMAALLAEAHASAGQLDEGLELLAHAICRVEAFGGHCHQAELHRLQGELRLQRAGGQDPEAERALRRALEIARDQECKSFELRAASSLARLWMRAERRGQARDLLQPVYDWFTEGFDTQDLKDAKALLEELA